MRSARPGWHRQARRRRSTAILDCVRSLPCRGRIEAAMSCIQRPEGRRARAGASSEARPEPAPRSGPTLHRPLTGWPFPICDRSSRWQAHRRPDLRRASRSAQDGSGESEAPDRYSRYRAARAAHQFHRAPRSASSLIVSADDRVMRLSMAASLGALATKTSTWPSPAKGSAAAAEIAMIRPLQPCSE